MADDAVVLKPARVLSPPGSGPVRPAMVLDAQDLSGQTDRDTVATGAVVLRYGSVLLQADQLTYNASTDLARAIGNVVIDRNGNTASGTELHLLVERFEGELLQPHYFFAVTQAGGQAQRLQFLGDQRVQATAATYSSCPIPTDGSTPAWQLVTDKLDMDFDANEGVATNAVVRFYGVPILAAPNISFALGDTRKSGWLPPDMSLDNRSGFEFGLPYYWNIAPQRDATLMPFVMTKRGVGLDSEFRYLEPEHQGTINFDWIPFDHVAGRSRWDTLLVQDGTFDDSWKYQVRSERVSDDDYWKDLTSREHSQTQRLLAGNFSLSHDLNVPIGDAQAYAKLETWQVLEGTDTTVQFAAPYQRSPQLGLRWRSDEDVTPQGGVPPTGSRNALEGGVEVEYNRFDLPGEALATQYSTLPGGQRLHMLGHVSVPFGGAGWWLIPKFSINAATYDLDQPEGGTIETVMEPTSPSRISRTIPTFSVDQGWVFERPTTLFGRDTLQTLEPRFFYVDTPYRDQLNMPNFDSTAKDFNFDSIYTDNQFTGVDRVSDASQLTAGVTTRWVDSDQGGELLRLGVAQRYLFRDQLITPDGTPQTTRASDLLLLASAHVNKNWWTDATVQYDPETERTERSVLSARYSPGQFRTVSVSYQLTRGQSEQVEVDWQWPLWGALATNGMLTRKTSSNSGCAGTWYSAGRLQYSLMDHRLIDSLVGMEYDAGCWILRVGLHRLSTGTAENNTGVLLQLELVGLSKLGSNALKLLRDNIPGYRPLSADPSASPDASYDR